MSNLTKEKWECRWVFEGTHAACPDLGGSPMGSELQSVKLIKYGRQAKNMLFDGIFIYLSSHDGGLRPFPLKEYFEC